MDVYAGPSVTSWLVIASGSFTGGICKGLTGYGSAIIIVLFWVTSKVLTLDPGPLSLAVITDSVGCLMTALPLFYLTRAHRMADWRLVGTLFTFKTALSPLGAVMLAWLDKRIVEAAMAVMLVPMIILTTNVLQEAPRLVKQLSTRMRSGSLQRLLSSRASSQELPIMRDHGGGYTAVVGSDQEAQPLVTGVSSSEGVRVVHWNESSCELMGSEHGPGSQRGVLTQGDEQCDEETGTQQQASKRSSACDIGCTKSTVGRRSVEQQHVQGTAACVQGAEGLVTPPGASTSQHERQAMASHTDPAETATPCGDAASTPHAHVSFIPSMGTPSVSDSFSFDALQATQAPVRAETAQWTLGDCDRVLMSNTEQQPLLPTTDTVSLGRDRQGQSNEIVETAGSVQKQQGPGLDEKLWPPRPSGVCASVAWLYACVRMYFSNSENRRVVGLGALAGSASGVMDGMTGMGGPPLMMLYRHLNVDKDVVRAIGAILNVFQFRLIAYIALGIVKRQDVPLILTGASLQLAGTVLADKVLNKHLSQAAFLRILVVLMVFCCVLLTAAAAGVTS